MCEISCLELTLASLSYFVCTIGIYSCLPVFRHFYRFCLFSAIFWHFFKTNLSLLYLGFPEGKSGSNLITKAKSAMGEHIVCRIPKVFRKLH